MPLGSLVALSRAACLFEPISNLDKMRNDIENSASPHVDDEIAFVKNFDAKTNQQQLNSATTAANGANPSR